MTFKRIFFSLIIAAIAVGATHNLWYQKGIKIAFTSNAAHDIQYQVFYTPEADGRFNEPQSVRQLVTAGVKAVEMILPAEKVARFRLDFGTKPETVTVSDIKIIGDTTAEIKNFNDYRYNQIDEHLTYKEGSVTITSNQGDPYMVTNDKLNINPAHIIDQHRVIGIALAGFFATYLLGALISALFGKKKK